MELFHREGARFDPWVAHFFCIISSDGLVFAAITGDAEILFAELGLDWLLCCCSLCELLEA
jgi:hypothetical protein